MAPTGCPGGLAARVQALRDEQVVARGRWLGWLLGVPVGAALSVGGIVEAQAGALVVACALVASWWWLREARRIGSEADDTLDELILQGWQKVAPEAVAGRLDTLLGARHRRRLARLLATGVYLPLPPPEAARATVADDAGLHRRRVEHVVHLLADVRRPVDPRGVILVRRLVRAAQTGEAPSDGREELGSALQRIERFI